MAHPGTPSLDSVASHSAMQTDGSILGTTLKSEILIRYGVIPDVVRVSAPEEICLQRGQKVVIRTRRGLELAVSLEAIRARPVTKLNGDASSEVNPEQAVDARLGSEEHRHSHDHDDRSSSAFEFVRVATADDVARFDELTRSIRSDLTVWEKRIREWGLELELLDGEWTLDRERLILYVLSGRGPDATKLSLQAGALGVLNLDVQPVTIDGRVDIASSGGGGGCGSGGCGCSH